jgi:hypothetical protein
MVFINYCGDLQLIERIGIMDVPIRFEVVKDVEFSNFRPLNVEDLDEMHGIKLKLLHLLSSYVSSFHVIFYLNGIFVGTHFEIIWNT